MEIYDSIIPNPAFLDELTYVLQPFFEVLAILVPILILISLVVIIIMIISLWKLYSKANQPGWASLIPFYSDFILYRITWGEGLNFLYSYVTLPLVPTIMSIILNIKVARCFGKSDGFAIGLILLPIVFYPILAFGAAEYKGPIHRLSDEK